MIVILCPQSDSKPIVILSPHRDDAVFSLAHALRYWAKESIPVRIVNFYTLSNYAPRALTNSDSSAGHISKLRRVEDRRAIRFVAGDVEQRDLNLLDAPLAFDIGVLSVSGPPAIAPRQEDIFHLVGILGALTRNTRVLAPLGLGNHVNHLAVKRAALACIHRKCLAFYEDLPYASWAQSDEWEARLAEAGRYGKVALRPFRTLAEGGAYWKKKACSIYGSQLDRRDAGKIAGFDRHAGRSERLWLPRHSRSWNTY